MSLHKKNQEKVGRPRSEASTEAIINATMDILEESGYQSLTIEAIAARAGVGKTTIYRWWSNKELLIIDVFLRITKERLKFDVELPIKTMFIQLLISLTEVFSKAIGRTTLSIVAQNEPQSEIAVNFYEAYLKVSRDACKGLLKHAAEQGEIHNSLPYDLILDMLFGPIYFKVLVYKDLATPEYIQALVNNVFEGIMVQKDVEAL